MTITAPSSSPIATTISSPHATPSAPSRRRRPGRAGDVVATLDAAEEAARLLDSTEFLRAILDAMQARVIIADRRLNVVYVNEIALDTLRGLEPELLNAFDVSVDELLYGSIHRFHRNPERVERILDDRTRSPATSPLPSGR